MFINLFFIIILKKFKNRKIFIFILIKFINKLVFKLNNIKIDCIKNNIFKKNFYFI